MKNTIVFLVFVLAVVGLLFSISGKKYPQLPADEHHKGVTEIGVCMGCHGPAGIKPRKPEHPPKDDCLKCHKQKREKKTS